MNKKLLFAVFMLFVLLQLMIPLSVIIKQEIVLRTGIVVKIKTQPIDPHDPFRGKYVTLSIANTIELPEEHGFSEDQKVYAVLKTQDDGYSVIETVSATRPGHQHYFKTKITSVGSRSAYVDIPFECYYIDERKARKAEEYYQKNSRREKHSAYIAVRLKSGHAALEELYVQNTPIIDYVIQQAEKEKANQAP